MEHPNPPLYLDYNATTPHDPEVIEAMRAYLEEHFGNPSSSHWYGRKTREAVETAWAQVAALLNWAPSCEVALRDLTANHERMRRTREMRRIPFSRWTVPHASGTHSEPFRVVALPWSFPQCRTSAPGRRMREPC